MYRDTGYVYNRMLDIRCTEILDMFAIFVLTLVGQVWGSVRGPVGYGPMCCYSEAERKEKG